MKRLILLFVLVCTACQSDGSSTPSPASNVPTYFPTVPGFTTQLPASRLPKAVASPALTVVPPTSTFTALPQPTPTSPIDPAAYEPYTIDALRNRTYGGGSLEVVETMEDNDLFTRYLIRYPSDDLTVYGFINVPKGDGPFPVIVAIHGLVDPVTYQTLDYTTNALDILTRYGYIVIHPNLRGYPPSDDGDNLFRVGMAVDVLNLLAMVKSGSGPEELFAKAIPENIGLWAHSMGGNIALRVLTVSPDIKVAVLFASMSGDDQKNSELLSGSSLRGPTSQTELETPPEIVQRISPSSYYGYITAAVQLQHGRVDQTIPIAWAEETCAALKAAQVETECIYYPTEDHTFRSRVADQVQFEMSDFYATYLSP
ncbi:MAG TPA: alpha/beta fold hydrolase [Anaerolineales bacterium]|nr:alpha/beta fold hydrolase [Anaerolineales bacterium]